MGEIKDECGVFGVYNNEEAPNITYLGLYALQHRGQESCGIASSDTNNIYFHKSLGIVNDVFKENTISQLKGRNAIGHVRYSTEGETLVKNAQPLVADYYYGSISVVHNGNITNSRMLKEELEENGSIFSSTSDTEVVIHLIASSTENLLIGRVIDSLRKLSGAYSFLFLSEKEMIAARDPFGFRPLVMGKLNNSIVFASETCALDLINAEYIRDVKPGEVILVSDDGIKSFYPFRIEKNSSCLFELIYFSRPDSLFNGKSIYKLRIQMGKELAKESAVNADIVIPVPDSGVPAALGFSKESGIDFEIGFTRNHYIGRTFIEPKRSIRHFGVKIKLNPVLDVIKGKRVIVVDDSVVRGTTSKKIVDMLKIAGAKETHLRLSSPMVIAPCFYGIDTPVKDELIASKYSEEEINAVLGANTTKFLSLEGLRRAVGGKANFCEACFSNIYPQEIYNEVQYDNQLKLFSKEIF
ncbi:amidophosphoribosyltransferase [Candidatus Acidulodesulfobacterium sp. H_13]|uniref:amidophosphoribosyltransferase n=1 Tax=Candidatus Acidulodesulfobacterium sp. H_13 TaxID=3395470 RepID=UPI003AF91E28